MTFFFLTHGLSEPQSSYKLWWLILCVWGVLFVCLFSKGTLSVIWGFYQTNPHKEFRTSKSAVCSVSRSSTEIIKAQQVKLAADGISAFLAWVCSGSQQQQHNIIQASWVWSVLLTVFKTVFISQILLKPDCINRHTRSDTDFQQCAHGSSHGLAQQHCGTTQLHFHI